MAFRFDMDDPSTDLSVEQQLKAELRALGLPTFGPVELLQQRLFQARNHVTKRSGPASSNMHGLDRELEKLEIQSELLSMKLEITRLEQQAKAIASSTPVANGRGNQTGRHQQQRPQPAIVELESRPSLVRRLSNDNINHVVNMDMTRPLSNPIHTSVEHTAIPASRNYRLNVEANRPQISVAGGSSQNVTLSDEQFQLLIESVVSKHKNHREDFGLPVPEPFEFDGDPIHYADWNRTFTAKVERPEVSDEDKTVYLKRYCKEKALKAVLGFCDTSPGATYYEIKSQVIDRRFGNQYVVAQAYIDKLDHWPKISDNDSTALTDLTQYLAKLRSVKAKQEVDLSILDHASKNKQIVKLLPGWLISPWRKKVIRFEDQNGGRYPDFNYLVDFLLSQAKQASHPVLSYEALYGESKAATHKGDKSKITHAISSESNNQSSNGLSKDKEDKPQSSRRLCSLCSENHRLIDCQMFKDMELSARNEHVKSSRSCFNCLKQFHTSRRCYEKPQCTKCSARHHVLLHTDESSDRDSNNQSHITMCNASNLGMKLCSMIVPVYVSVESDPNSEVLIYAMLDSMSDNNYVTHDLMTKLESKSYRDDAKLKLTTMTTTDEVVNCSVYYDISVRGYSRSKRISVPMCHTRDAIPHNRDHIPTRDIAEKWSHLHGISNHIPPKLPCKVSMLIGYNCPMATIPRRSIFIEDHPLAPVGAETALGWSIVGNVNPELCTDNDTIGLSHNISVFKVPPNLQVETQPVTVSICNRIMSKDVSVSDALKALEPDFENVHTESCEAVSQNDLAFMQIMNDHVYQDSDGFVTMPLPFKPEKPSLCSNRYLALQRFQQLERRLSRNMTFRGHYFSFMKGVFERGKQKGFPKMKGISVMLGICHIMGFTTLRSQTNSV